MEDYALRRESNTIVHKNGHLPTVSAIPVRLDRAYVSYDVSLGSNTREKYDIGMARLKSLGKERTGSAAGDQIISLDLGDSKDAFAVIDGITPLPQAAEALRDPKEFLPRPELDAYIKATGDDFLENPIPPDAAAAILIAKLFPFSREYQTLKLTTKDIRARDLMIAADKFMRRVYEESGLMPLEQPFRPGAMATFCTIDGNTGEITTAQTGDCGAAYEPWLNKWDLNMRSIWYEDQAIALTVDQVAPFDNDLHEKLRLSDIRFDERQRHPLYRKLLEENYNSKFNLVSELGGVGVLNGNLNHLLIQERKLKIDDCILFVLYTDSLGLHRGKTAVNTGWRLLGNPSLSFLEGNRYGSNVFSMPGHRDDDGAIIVIHNKNHQSADKSGMTEYYREILLSEI